MCRLWLLKADLLVPEQTKKAQTSHLCSLPAIYILDPLDVPLINFLQNISENIAWQNLLLILFILTIVCFPLSYKSQVRYM